MGLNHNAELGKASAWVISRVDRFSGPLFLYALVVGYYSDTVASFFGKI